MRILLFITVIVFLGSCKSRTHESGQTAKTTVEQLQVQSGFPLSKKVPEGLAAAALSWWGTPYKYGGTNARGVDCSGLIINVYREVYNVSLPRTTEELARYGKKVNVRKAAPGDLVFFKLDGKKVSHVGIMLDAIHFLHASTSKGVRIDSREQEYWAKRLASIVRLSKT